MLINKIEVYVDYLVKNKKCKTENKEIVVYGINTSFSYLLNFITTIFIGLLFGMITESIIFLISFSLIRSFSGGYHCRNTMTCYLSSSLIVVISLLILKIVPINYMVRATFAILLVSVPFIMKIAPVEAVSKPLDDIEKNIFRKKTIENLIIECLLISVLFWFGYYSYVFIVSIAIFTVSYLLLAQLIVMRTHLI